MMNNTQIQPRFCLSDSTVELAAKPLLDGVPCAHRGCLHHVTHPCEGCGRIAGRSPAKEQAESPNAEITGCALLRSPRAMLG